MGLNNGHYKLMKKSTQRDANTARRL